MTWASFSNLFMEKYIPRTLRGRRRDEFLSLDQGRMSVVAYENQVSCTILVCHSDLLKSTRANSPLCERIDVRFVDSSLTVSCYSKIFSGKG